MKQAYQTIIVGGGAGGSELAVRLADQGDREVLLIDRNHSHVWKPRWHELAAGAGRGHVNELKYAGIAERWGFAFQQGDLLDVLPDENSIVVGGPQALPGGEVEPRRLCYSQLVLAIGGVTADMGVKGVREHAVLLDSADQAEALCERLSKQLLANAAGDGNRPVDMVIVGSGPTGVELAGFLATGHQSNALTPAAGGNTLNIVLLEAVDEFMPGTPRAVSDSVRQRLTQAGVDIVTGAKVGEITEDAVRTGSGERYASQLTVWVAGQMGPPIASKINNLPRNGKNQWLTGRDLRAKGQDNIFVMGDCGCIEDNPAPPTAQAASEQAEHLAQQLPRLARGRRPRVFQYRDKGTLLSLGEAGAVGRLRVMLDDDLQIRGRLARAAYRGVQRRHQMLLLGVTKALLDGASNFLETRVGPRIKVH